MDFANDENLFLPPNVAFKDTCGVRCPEICVWEHATYIAVRQLQAKVAKLNGLSNPLFADCGNDVSCDQCSAIMTEERIVTIDFGGRVLCLKCIAKWANSGYIKWADYDFIVRTVIF